MKRGSMAASQAREKPGVEDAAGVDALILHLLTDLGAAQEASQFAGRPGCRAEVKHMRERLSTAGQEAALAHLAASCGHSQEALQLWRVPALLPRLEASTCVAGCPLLSASSCRQQHCMASSADCPFHLM